MSTGFDDRRSDVAAIKFKSPTFVTTHPRTKLFPNAGRSQRILVTSIVGNQQFWLQGICRYLEPALGEFQYSYLEFGLPTLVSPLVTLAADKKVLED